MKNILTNSFILQEGGQNDGTGGSNLHVVTHRSCQWDNEQPCKRLDGLKEIGFPQEGTPSTQ